MSKRRNALTYRDAGVDIDKGNRLVERIKPLIQPTLRPEVLAGVGGFGALMEIPPGYRRPVLVSGTDGVGTKLMLALQLGVHDTIGIDLVAMCANDVLTVGAEPLFFLDYMATGQLDEAIAVDVIKGIAEGCRQAGAALIGGETAEMPGVYSGHDYDLAGFCVGVVERDAIIDGQRVACGDALIGLAASGPHSNGYSLIRKVLEISGARLDARFEEGTLGDALLTPTRIYRESVQRAVAHLDVKAIAHITGGGLTENLPRVLPEGLGARIHTDTWPRPAIFQWLATQGGIEEAELLRTFNCGLGMIVCVPGEQAREASILLGEPDGAFVIGEIVEAPGTARISIE